MPPEPLEVDLDPSLVRDLLAAERVQPIEQTLRVIAFWYVMGHYRWRPEDYRVLLSKLHTTSAVVLSDQDRAALFLKFCYHYDYPDDRIDELVENVCEFKVAKVCDRIVERLLDYTDMPTPAFRAELW